MPARRDSLLTVVLPALLMGAGVGCDRFPQDPRGSLKQALERDTLRVGVTESAPWVTGQRPGAPGGLGRMKLPLAKELHEKTLHADATMNKADWLTAVAMLLERSG